MDERRLRAIFRREQARFMAHFPRQASVRLILVDRRCPKGDRCDARDFGFCTYNDGARSITFIRRILTLPEPKILGLLQHELGHAFDDWIDHPGAEQRADDLAEWVTGQKIRYDKNDIQTIGRGTYPRPLHLHR